MNPLFNLLGMGVPTTVTFGICALLVAFLLALVHVVLLKDTVFNMVAFTLGTCGICHTDITTKNQYIPYPLHGSFFGQSSFASHAMVTEDNIVKADNSIPIEILGPLGGGPNFSLECAGNPCRKGYGKRLGYQTCADAIRTKR